MRTTQEIIDALRVEAPMVFNTLYGDTMKEAADMIEALVADLKEAARCDICALCAHGQHEPPCVIKFDFLCDDCQHDCACKNCKEASAFEWRGVQKEKHKEGQYAEN